MKRVAALGLGMVTIALLIGCEEGPTNLGDADLMSPLFSRTSSGSPALVCETIDFKAPPDINHGDAISSATALGVNFAITVTTTAPSKCVTPDAYAFWVESPDNQRATDMLDPAFNPLGRCPDCAGQGNLLIVKQLGFEPPTNLKDCDISGGETNTIRFDPDAEVFIRSWLTFDMEEDNPGPEFTDLLVDGTFVASSGTGTDASVLKTDVPDVPVADYFEFVMNGSGGIDDIEVCRSVALGRMTGGGGYIGMTGTNGEEVHVTHGFTVHCDVELTNNLEINWADHRWHIEKEFFLPGYPVCTDEPDVSPEPPPAPFDTFEGKSIGRLNNVWGSPIHFILQDSGEPGGKNDKGMIMIWDVGANPMTDAPILNVPFDFLQHGNLQAHYDQPHGCNVNGC